MADGVKMSEKVQGKVVKSAVRGQMVPSKDAQPKGDTDGKKAEGNKSGS